MGNKAVGEVQYNLDDLEQAGRKVTVSLDPDSMDGEARFPGFKALDLGEQGEACIKDCPEEPQGVLRKRKPHKDSADVSHESDDEGFEIISRSVEDISLEENKESIGSRQVNSSGWNDPLKWFGVLVPQALRNSQSQFKTAIELCCTLASLKARLLKLKAEYKKLLLEKDTLLTSLGQADAGTDPTSVGGDETLQDTSS